MLLKCSLPSIINAQPEDSGTYRCTASNPAGRSVGRIQFYIVGKALSTVSVTFCFEEEKNVQNLLHTFCKGLS